jgi:RNA polymerase sigma-70 factor (ECF subfamily)
VDPADDDSLMALYCEGDADAFDALFARHHAAVYNFARFMLGAADGAEEIMQDTFLAVAGAAGRYEPRGRFRPWLMRIVRNQCLNRMQAERARRVLTLDEHPAAMSRCSDPAEEAESAERVALVRQAIAALPERQREAIVLYAFEQMSYAEIAETLRAPINTVKTLIHRARAALALQFEETGQ